MIARPTYILHANDEGRALVLSNVHKLLDRLPADNSWQVTFSRYEKKQTRKQRGALFGVAYAAIMDHIGLRGDDEKRELHRYFCGEFFGWRDSELSAPRPVRTTTTNERGERDPITWRVAADLYDFIQQKAAEQAIIVPDPDPLWKTQEGTI